jgi:hypothetical protein
MMIQDNERLMPQTSFLLAVMSQDMHAEMVGRPSQIQRAEHRFLNSRSKRSLPQWTLNLPLAFKASSPALLTT